eukprot:3255768-Pleurochrysis_carterae.AAC.1
MTGSGKDDRFRNLVCARSHARARPGAVSFLVTSRQVPRLSEQGTRGQRDECRGIGGAGAADRLASRSPAFLILTISRSLPFQYPHDFSLHVVSMLV